MDLFDRLETASPPLLTEHCRIWQLLAEAELYETSSDNDQLMLEALREISIWHFCRNASYRRFCEAHGFDPTRDLASGDDIGSIPPMFASTFKHFDVATESDSTVLTISSSGTSGSPTVLSMDLETILRMWTMGRRMFQEEGLISNAPVHYIVLAPDPENATRRGNAFFFTALTKFAPAAAITYAVAETPGGSLELETGLIEQALSECGKHDMPVRVVGLPFLVARAALATKAVGFKAHAESLVLTGGGWKTLAGDAMKKDELRALLADAWDISDSRVRDLYGMTEHAVHYLECEHHTFHVPVFARVRIIEPLSAQTVEDGQEGVIHLINPGMTTLPAHSLVTADRATWVECPCGRSARGFRVTGRGGVTQHRGCAATTLERMRV